MGSYTSRLFSYHNEHEAKTKTQANSTTPCRAEKIRMCTPPMTKRKLGNDPRSATIGITRTPIEVTCTPPELTRRVASALPKYLQGKRYLETDFDADMPVTTPEKCILDPRSPNVIQQRTPIMVKPVANYFSPVITINKAPDIDTPVEVGAPDPRSPAIDFDRTPILKPRSTERAATSSDNSFVQTTDCKNRYAILSYCETTTDYSIPEIQAIYETVSGTEESLSMENLTYPCENPKESTSRPVSSEETESDGSENEEQQITVIRNPKVLSSSYHDALSTWTEDKACGTDEDIGEEKSDGIDESMGKTLDNDIREMIKTVIKNTIDERKNITNNDKIKVWRDSTSPSINEEAKNSGQKANEEIIIEFDDEAVAKNSKSVNTPKVNGKIDDDKSKNQAKKKKSQQQQQQQMGENKPLTEDRKIFNNEGKNLIDATLNRTPLGNRSNNHKQRQLLSAKSPQQLLRNKGLSARTIQQENTPPTERHISKTKPHGIQWDPDTTVII